MADIYERLEAMRSGTPSASATKTNSSTQSLQERLNNMRGTATPTPTPVITPPSTSKVEEGENLFERLTGNLFGKSAQLQAANAMQSIAALTRNEELKSAMTPVAQKQQEAARERLEGPSFGNYLLRKGVGGAADTVEGVLNTGGYWAQGLAKGYEMQAANALKGAAATAKNEYAKDVLTQQADKQQAEALKNLKTSTKTVFNFADNYAAKTEEMHTDNDYGFVGNLAGDVAQGVGGMIPRLVAKGVPGLGDAITLLSSFGNAMQSAKNEGKSDAEALPYAFATAVVEVAIEKVSGLGDFGGKGFSDNIIDGIVKGITKNAAAQKGLRVLASGIAEGLEETVTEYANRLINAITIKTDERSFGETSADAFYNGLVGSVVGTLSSTANPDTYKTADNKPTEGKAPTESAENNTPTEGENLRSDGTLENAANVTSENADQRQGDPDLAAGEIRAERDASGNVTVIIDADILAGKPKGEWRKAISNEIQRIFKNGVKLPRGTVFSNKRGRGEFTNGSYTRMLERTDPAMYEDKMRMASGADVLLQSAENITNEDPTHDRSDDIVSFNRGNISVKVKGSGYTGDILTAIYSDGKETFFDINNLARNENEATPERYAAGNANGFSQTGATSNFNVAQPGANVNGSIYSPNVMGAAAVAQGELVDTQSKTILKNINLSEKSREANAPAQHERVSAALSLARAGASIYVDSEGNILLEQSIDNLLDKDRWTGSDSDAAELLMKEAESRADVDAVKRIAERIVSENTEAGRLLQAQQKWIDASPGNRLAAMYAYVNKFAQEHKARKNGAIEIPDNLAKAYLEAKTEAERDDVISQIQKHVASQARPTFLEAWNALRYTNMLGNFKTQARNILGNVANKAQYFAKNQLANLIEVAANKVSKGKIGRTKSAVVGREWMKAANADFANVRKRVQQYGKYTDDNFKGDFAQGIEDARKLLPPVFEQYRRATAWAMDTGDLIFSKSAYARSLAGYLKANGVKAQQLEAGTVPAELLTKARDYAVQQAQEATFRDSNEFSDWVSRIGRRPDTPKAAKALAEGLLPFRRTPANVFVRAEEFSPLGLINTAVKAAQTKNGKATANDVIESLSKSLTGSALMMLGYFLANNGYLRASGDEEDEELDALLDKQDWAIQIPGVGSYTIDWMAPASLELFMGAQLQQLLSDEDLTFADVLDVFSGLTEPIIQMSMLSGVNDTLDGIKYSDNGLIQIAAQLAIGYLSQGLTNTLLGQVERSLEPERMSTYVDKQGVLPDWLQRGIGKASAKIPLPFVDYQQTKYLNEFGETEQSGLGERLIENFISPGYFQAEKTDNLYTFIEELAGKMDTKPFPDAYAPYSVTINGTVHNLTQEQRDAYQMERGQTAKEYLEFMQDSAEFNKLPVAYQEEVVSEAMSFANKKGAEAAVGNANFTKEEAFANKQMNAYEYLNWLISEVSTPVANGYKTEPDWQTFERAADVLPQNVAISMMVAENESMGKKIDAAVKTNIPLAAAVAYYRAITERNAAGKSPTAEQKAFRISMLGLTQAQEDLLSEIFK